MKRHILWILALLIGLVGCGNVEIGLETTPTVNQAATATVQSLTQQNEQLQATVEAIQPTATTTNTLGLLFERDGKLYRGDFAGDNPQKIGELPREMVSALQEGDYYVATQALKLNGHYLAYGIGPRIGVIDLATGKNTVLYTNERTTFLGMGVHQVMWSSDGTAVVYAMTYGVAKDVPSGWETEVGVVEVASGKRTVVATEQSAGTAFSLVSYDVAKNTLWLVPRGGDPAVVQLRGYHIGTGNAPDVYPIDGDGGVAGSTKYLAVAANTDPETRIARTLVYDLSHPAEKPTVIQHPNATYGTNYLWHDDQLAFLLGRGISWMETTGTVEGIAGWDATTNNTHQLAPATTPMDMPLVWSEDGAWLATVSGQRDVSRQHWASSFTQKGEPIQLHVEPTDHILGWVTQ